MKDPDRRISANEKPDRVGPRLALVAGLLGAVDSLYGVYDAAKKG